MTSSTNTATNTNNKGYLYSDEIDWFILREIADEEQDIEWDIELYEKLYREFYENIDYADLFHDPLELLEFIVMHKRESRFTTEIIDEKAELEIENENLKYENEKLRKEINTLKANHIKSMMTDFEKSKLEREIMNKLMNEQSNTILQLRKEIGRLKNRNKKLSAKINDLYDDMME